MNLFTLFTHLRLSYDIMDFDDLRMYYGVERAKRIWEGVEQPEEMHHEAFYGREDGYESDDLTVADSLEDYHFEDEERTSRDRNVSGSRGISATEFNRRRRLWANRNIPELQRLAHELNKQSRREWIARATRVLNWVSSYSLHLKSLLGDKYQSHYSTLIGIPLFALAYPKVAILIAERHGNLGSPSQKRRVATDLRLDVNRPMNIRYMIQMFSWIKPDLRPPAQAVAEARKLFDFPWSVDAFPTKSSRSSTQVSVVPTVPITAPTSDGLKKIFNK